MPGDHILVVEDDHAISELVRTHLEREGFRVHIAPEANRALMLLQQHAIKLIILDIMLPGMSGFDLLPQIRRQVDVPVIVLSARGDEPDKIVGLGLGADDYVAKPFSSGELVARVKAHLRRYKTALQPVELSEAPMVFGDLLIDTASRLVHLYGQPVELTRTEFAILALLAAQPGRAFTFDQIYAGVWQEEPLDSHNLVMVHVKKLREKLGDNAREPRYIRTVWGVGYRFIG